MFRTCARTQLLELCAAVSTETHAELPRVCCQVLRLHHTTEMTVCANGIAPELHEVLIDVRWRLPVPADGAEQAGPWLHAAFQDAHPTSPMTQTQKDAREKKNRVWVGHFLGLQICRVEWSPDRPKASL